uniref:Uncharacterized protein n=1 Tax=Arundo donax TaxID=35708 RepID=A0A0A8Z1M3_ARUDO
MIYHCPSYRNRITFLYVHSNKNISYSFKTTLEILLIVMPREENQ